MKYKNPSRSIAMPEAEIEQPGSLTAAEILSFKSREILGFAIKIRGKNRFLALRLYIFCFWVSLSSF